MLYSEWRAPRLATSGRRQQHIYTKATCPAMPCHRHRQQMQTACQGFILQPQSEYITCGIVAMFSQHPTNTVGNTHAQSTKETTNRAAVVCNRQVVAGNRQPAKHAEHSQAATIIKATVNRQPRGLLASAKICLLPLAERMSISLQRKNSQTTPFTRQLATGRQQSS